MCGWWMFSGAGEGMCRTALTAGPAPTVSGEAEVEDAVVAVATSSFSVFAAPSLGLEDSEGVDGSVVLVDGCVSSSGAESGLVSFIIWLALLSSAGVAGSVMLLASAVSLAVLSACALSGSSSVLAPSSPFSHVGSTALPWRGANPLLPLRLLDDTARLEVGAAAAR